MPFDDIVYILSCFAQMKRFTMLLHDNSFISGEDGTRTHDLLTASQKYYILVFISFL